MDSDCQVEVDWLNYSKTDNGECLLRMKGNGWVVWLNREGWGTPRVRFILDQSGRKISTTSDTGNTSGKFKLVFTASDNVVTGYWHNGTDWAELDDTSGYTLSETNGIQVELRAWSGGGTGITIDFDNFEATGEEHE